MMEMETVQSPATGQGKQKQKVDMKAGQSRVANPKVSSGKVMNPDNRMKKRYVFFHTRMYQQCINNVMSPFHSSRNGMPAVVTFSEEMDSPDSHQSAFRGSYMVNRQQ